MKTLTNSSILVGVCLRICNAVQAQNSKAIPSPEEIIVTANSIEQTSVPFWAATGDRYRQKKHSSSSAQNLAGFALRRAACSFRIGRAGAQTSLFSCAGTEVQDHTCSSRRRAD